MLKAIIIVVPFYRNYYSPILSLVKVEKKWYEPGRFPAGMQDCWCGSKRWTVPRRGGLSPIMAFIGCSFSGKASGRKIHILHLLAPLKWKVYTVIFTLPSRSMSIFRGVLIPTSVFLGGFWGPGFVVWIKSVFFCWGLGQMCFFPYNRRLNSLTWFGSIDKTWWEWKPRMSNTMLAVYILGSSYIYI